MRGGGKKRHSPNDILLVVYMHQKVLTKITCTTFWDGKEHRSSQNWGTSHKKLRRNWVLMITFTSRPRHPCQTWRMFQTQSFKPQLSWQQDIVHWMNAIPGERHFLFIFAIVSRRAPSVTISEQIFSTAGALVVITVWGVSPTPLNSPTPTFCSEAS